MANVKKRIRKAVKSVRKFAGRVNTARVAFKRKHPRVYKYAKRAIVDGAINASGYGGEVAVAHGLYRAYKGRDRGLGYQARNALSTYRQYSSNKYGG